MRQFIRHPATIPLEYSIKDTHSSPQSMRNISEGGVSFICTDKLEVGAEIVITIRTIDPEVELIGRVVWNSNLPNGQYLVGVKFAEQEHYRARMVEQVCHIEQYRQAVFREEGRLLSIEQAAQEWILRYAERFPE